MGIVVPLSRQEVERAKQWRHGIAVEQGHGHGFFAGKGWVGWLGERALEQILREQGVPAVRHGGVDRLPDLDVAGRTVAVKTTQKKSLAIVPRPHVDQTWDWFFFCGWLERERAVELRGAIRPAAFRQRARLHEVGSAAWVRFPCYSVDVSELVPAEEWIRAAREASRSTGTSIPPSALDAA